MKIWTPDSEGLVIPRREIIVPSRGRHCDLAHHAVTGNGNPPSIVVTFDPTHKSTSATLSNGNLTLSPNASGYPWALGTVGRSSGKWYFEIHLDQATTSFSWTSMGVAVQSVTFSGPIGSDGVHQPNVGFSFNQNGCSKYVNNSFGLLSGSGTQPTTGAYIGIALDFGTGALNIYINGAFKATLTTGLAGTLYPAAQVTQSISIVTANFGATTFSYPPPSGYSSWDGSQVF